MNMLARLLRLYFHHLYHALAWTYDAAAWLVSLGRWQDWIMTTIPYLEGRRILELGHGPGHLQRALLSRGLFAIGLDESPQMGRLAARRLRDFDCTQINLTRGLAQALPFPAACFQTVVATFPAKYILETSTIQEAYRVLAPGGRFVVLPFAWITGRRTLERLLAWLNRITGEAPDPVGVLSERMKMPFLEAGFRVEVERLEVRSSLLLIVLAQKPG